MEKSAPLEIIQSANQPTEDLHQGAGEQLTNLGQPAQTVPDTQNPIPLTDELKQIGVGAWHIIGTPIEEVLTGEAPDARVRGSKASRFLDFIRRRGKSVQNTQLEEAA